MAAPGSVSNKLPRLGKVAAHLVGLGRIPDAMDAGQGLRDPDIGGFTARAERALANRGATWSSLDEVDRGVAVDRLAEVLEHQDALDIWGCALEGRGAIVKHVMSHGGEAAIAEFGVRDVQRDEDALAPGKLLVEGSKTSGGEAFALLLEVVSDLMHVRASEVVATVDQATILGALRRLTVAQTSDRAQRRANQAAVEAKLEHIETLLTAVAASAAGAPRGRWPGPIRIGEDVWPREAIAFVPRPESQRIRDAQAQDSAVTLCQLDGMRGVGKSQLAAAYARDCAGYGYDVVAWIDARTRADVVANLGKLVAAYGVAEPDEAPEKGIARLLDRFAGAPPEERRLVVFDNVESHADLTRCLPHDPVTKVIVTTTQRTEVIGTRVPVEVFDEQVGADYLDTRTGLADPSGALAVCRAVGSLALALAQAASTIGLRGYDYDRFLAALAARPLRDNLLREEGTDYPDGAARAIGLALETFLTAAAPDGSRHAHPLQEELLAVLDALALLAESGVPIAWLRALGDEFRIDDAIAWLAKASLASYSDDTSSVTLHRLTRRVYAEESLGDAPGTERARSHARRALDAGLPADEDPYPVRRQALANWLDHIASSLTSESGLWRDRAVLGLVQHGVYLGNLHHVPYAVIACAALPGISAGVLGPDHPDTLGSRNNLAGAYESAGDLARAIPLFKQTLTDRERVLGPDHPNTLTSRNNLAGAYQAAGDLARAIPLYQQTLTASERILGPDHPDTLGSRNNLALALWQSGKRNDAVAMMEQAERVARARLSTDHPLTDRLAQRVTAMRAALTQG